MQAQQAHETEWNKQTELQKQKAEAEAARRMQVCQRFVGRLKRQQLARSWSQFVQCVRSQMAAREMVQKVVTRMQQTGRQRIMAAAFSCYFSAVKAIVMQRQNLAKIASKWRTPACSNALDAWLQYVDIMHQVRVCRCVYIATHQGSCQIREDRY